MDKLRAGAAICLKQYICKGTHIRSALRSAPITISDIRLCRSRDRALRQHPHAPTDPHSSHPCFIRCTTGHFLYSTGVRGYAIGRIADRPSSPLRHPTVSLLRFGMPSVSARTCYAFVYHSLPTLSRGPCTFHSIPIYSYT